MHIATVPALREHFVGRQALPNVVGTNLAIALRRGGYRCYVDGKTKISPHVETVMENLIFPAIGVCIEVAGAVFSFPAPNRESSVQQTVMATDFPTVDDIMGRTLFKYA